MPSIHWRSAALAGIAAGVVATVAQIALWWAASEPLPAILVRDARLTAAIVMGRQVLPPPATFDWSIMLVATLVHFALSIAYGLTLSLLISRLSTPRSLLAGAAFGLFLYAINMYGFTFVFPWFAAARDWITANARRLRHGRGGCLQDVADADFSFNEGELIHDAATISFMRMPMMDVRKVSMPVHGGLMQMRMSMRFGAVPLECVVMLMVLVMSMRVHVLDRLVDVLMDVMFA
jgi:hypothetical protein